MDYKSLIEGAIQTLNTYKGMREWGQLTDKDVDDAYNHFLGKLALIPEHTLITTDYGYFVRDGNLVYQHITIFDFTYMTQSYDLKEVNSGRFND